MSFRGIAPDVEVNSKWFTQHGPFCVHFDSIMSTKLDKQQSNQQYSYEYHTR